VLSHSFKRTAGQWQRPWRSVLAEADFTVAAIRAVMPMSERSGGTSDMEMLQVVQLQRVDRMQQHLQADV
jgi:hypothetical protein